MTRLFRTAPIFFIVALASASSAFAQQRPTEHRGFIVVNGGYQIIRNDFEKASTFRAAGIPSPIGTTSDDLARLDSALTRTGARRMVVGHTVQEGGITTACGGKLWRIDVGLAALYGGPIQVLELVPAPKVLTGTR